MGQLCTGEVLIEKRISLLGFETAQSKTDRGVWMIVPLRCARVFRKIFAGQEPNALNRKKCSGCRQESAPPRDRHWHSRIFRLTLDAGVGEKTKDERQQQDVGRNVQIKIDKRVHDVSRHRGQRPEIEGQARA